MINLKRLNKFISVFLAAILCLTPLISVSAVNYPEGTDAASSAAAVPKLNILVKTLMKTAVPSGDIKDTVYKTICSDSTLNSMFAGIYGSMAENADSLSMIGVKLTPQALSQAMSAYPDVSRKLASCTNLNACIELSKGFRWKVSTKEEFSAAFAAMMSPFNSLLYAVLCSGTVKVSNLITIKGADGYQASVVPLLKAMGCPSIMSSADFAADAAKAGSRMIKNIMKMLFASVDRLLDDPVIGATSTLPGFAYYLDSGKLSASVKALLEPLSVKIAGIFTVPGISDLINKAVDLENGIDLNSAINKITEQAGKGSGFILPEIDIKALAECGTPSGDSFTPDTGAALITVMRWAVEALRLNSSKLTGNQENSAESPITALLNKSDDELIKIIITLLNISTSAPANNYNWVYPGITPSVPVYTEKLTAAEFGEIIEKIDPLLTEFIQEEDPEGTIGKVIRKKIYSNEVLSKIVQGLFSALASEKIAGMAGLLGIAVYPKSVADSISASYPYAAKVLYRCSAWDDVNVKAMSWGFYDGDSDAFINALTKVLSPFTPLLGCLLAEQPYTLLGAINIPGADGYNTVIIPLLEALGCSSDNIKTYEEYKKTASGKAALTDILNPIFALIDEICQMPVKTICRILPNIIYFIDSGLISVCMENLLYPVKFMLDTAGIGDMFSGAFESLPPLDINAKVKEMLSSSDMELKLPDPDIKKLGTAGNPQTLQSKRTFSGAPSQYVYITADSPAVLLTLLRYLIGALSLPENAHVLEGFMDGMTGGSEEAPEPEEGEMPDMFAMFAANIGEKFKGMTTDQIIEWLYDLLFRETPMVHVHDEAEIPTIIYEEEFHIPGWVYLLVIFIFFLSAFTTYFILLKKGKLDAVLEKRQKKRDEKKRREELEKLIAAKIKSGEMKADEAPDFIKPKKNKKSRTEQKPANPYASKETQKLEKRQNKAAKRSEKNDIKTQKHYEKAVKEAQKKATSGRDKK